MRDQIFQELDKIKMPNGQSIVALDMVRALTIDEGHVQFVIEAPSAAVAGVLESLRQQAVEAVTALAGVNKTSVILTAHSGAAEKPEPPQLKIGGHPKPQAAPMKLRATDGYRPKSKLEDPKQIDPKSMVFTDKMMS